MISKISYIKLIREDIRHRGWLAALSGVLLFLSMPVYTLIYLDSYSEDPEVLKEFAVTFSGFINGYNSAFLIILIGILAFAVGISGFQFMHKKEKLDFYHGLALKRHQLFAISYLAGLFLFLIPYIVCTVLTILVGAVKGIMTLSLAGECFLTMGTGILAFLLIYHTCIFAGMLTGRSVTMFLGTLVIGVYPSLVLTLLPSLRDAFSRLCGFRRSCCRRTSAGRQCPCRQSQCHKHCISTEMGSTADGAMKIYLRPETAQGIFRTGP